MENFDELMKRLTAESEEIKAEVETNGNTLTQSEIAVMCATQAHQQAIDEHTLFMSQVMMNM